MSQDAPHAEQKLKGRRRLLNVVNSNRDPHRSGTHVFMRTVLLYCFTTFRAPN